MTTDVVMLIGSSEYIVVLNGQVVEVIKAFGATAAAAQKTKEGVLYVRMGGQ